MASLLVHVAVFAWLVFGLARAPYIENRTIHKRFTVRILNVPMTQPEVRQYAAAGSPVHPAALPAHSSSQPISAPVPPAQVVAPAAAQSAPPAPSLPDKPAPALPAAVQLAQTVHQSQTLVQPDAPKDLLLQHPTPIPLVMMWSQVAPPKTVPTPPQKAIISNVHPSIALPNREQAPAEVRISSSNFTTALPALAPGTTSPIVVRGPEPVKQMPTTASQSPEPPTSVRILSLSDRQMQEGPVAVPLANASARPSPSQSLTAGKSENSADAGRGGASGKQPAASATPAGNATGASGGAAPSGQGAPAPAQSSDAGIGTQNPSSVTRISLPKDGQFGVVVVGSSLADQYPETAAVWSGRLVYTVYLHVGMGKSWILQYSLPPNAQAAASGNTRPDAPWPYDIVVPRLDPNDYTSDALMVHGFVNPAGRFERLTMVLPGESAQTKFVLNTLQQWQFRPARQNGQVATVEILLIIPAEGE